VKALRIEERCTSEKPNSVTMCGTMYGIAKRLR